jgi:hypothetical protein
VRRALSVLLVAGCSQQPAESALRAAECGAVHEFYTHAATELIDRGACDAHARVEDCPAYAVLEELYVATLLHRKCPAVRS